MSSPELVLISKDKQIIERVQSITEEFQYGAKLVPDVDQFFMEELLYAQTSFVILSAVSVENKQDVAGMIQVAKQTAPQAYIMVVLHSRVAPEETEFMKKSGASIVLLETEITESSKLEFILTNSLRTNFLPVKTEDIQAGAKIDCNVYHLMPLNKKYIPVLTAGQELSENKKEKLKQIGEVYIRKEQAEQYQKYTESIKDNSPDSVARRCRAQFLNMCTSFKDLVLLLSDQGEYASFQEGKVLYEKCLELAKELLTNLSAVGEPWNIINNSSIGQFGSVERSPAIAAYAGLLSLQTSIGTPEDCMIAALMADIGMIMLSPSVNKKIRAQRMNSLTPEERAEYEKHPIYGLNQCLSRKVPIPENIKNVILTTHERADKQGFPNQPNVDKIPDESMIIQLCELIDNETTLRMGQQRADVLKVRREVFDREQARVGHFSPNFISRLKPYLLNQV